jgi:hypothetical protein
MQYGANAAYNFMLHRALWRGCSLNSTENREFANLSSIEDAKNQRKANN